MRLGVGEWDRRHTNGRIDFEARAPARAQGQRSVSSSVLPSRSVTPHDSTSSTSSSPPLRKRASTASGPSGQQCRPITLAYLRPIPGFKKASLCEELTNTDGSEQMWTESEVWDSSGARGALPSETKAAVACCCGATHPSCAVSAFTAEGLGRPRSESRSSAVTLGHSQRQSSPSERGLGLAGTRRWKGRGPVATNNNGVEAAPLTPTQPLNRRSPSLSPCQSPSSIK
ncbi:unnamed protein product [Lampetra planeri]